jgi:hypothetical protein
MWDFLFEEGADLRALRSRATRGRLEKTAGVFMRPSDIAGHTELAHSLESLLNGQPDGSTFKAHPGEAKTAGAADAAIGAVIGGSAGYLAMSRARNNPVPPPEGTQGIGNKLQSIRHNSNKVIVENPTMSKALGTVMGATAGAVALHDKNIVQRLRDFKRGG